MSTIEDPKSELTSERVPSVLSRDERSYARIVWDLAWPAIGLNSLQVVNGLLDVKFIGHLGPNALAGQGAAFNVVFLLMSLAMALGTGATALVSRFYGAKSPEDLANASRQSLSLSILLGVIFCVIGFGYAPNLILALTNSDPVITKQAMLFMTPVLLGLPAVFIFNTLASNLRAIGNTMTPMIVSGLAIVVHVIFNVLLIFPTREVNFLGFGFVMPGANMGMSGAGTAFAISAWFSAFAYFPASNRTVLGSMWRLQWIEIAWAVRILKIAAGAAVASVLRVASFILFTAILSRTTEGPLALGAFAIGIRVEAIAFMPVFGYMIAAAALVGQSLGMKDPHRAEKLAWAANRQAVIVTVIVSLFFIIFSYPLASFFAEDPVQRYLAAMYLFCVALTEPLFASAMVLTGAQQGAGDTIRPTWISFISQWLLRIPAAWVFAIWLGFGTLGAWWVMSITQAVNGLMMITLFRKGKWKEKKV